MLSFEKCEKDMQIARSQIRCQDCRGIMKNKLLAISCVTTNKYTKCWLIDNSCTNHMTHN